MSKSSGILQAAQCAKVPHSVRCRQQGGPSPGVWRAGARMGRCETPPRWIPPATTAAPTASDKAEAPPRTPGDAAPPPSSPHKLKIRLLQYNGPISTLSYILRKKKHALAGGPLHECAIFAMVTEAGATLRGLALWDMDGAGGHDPFPSACPRHEP